MSWWNALDLAVFHWVNATTANPVFDAFLPLCREKWLWAPLYLFIVAFVLQNFGLRRGGLFLAGLVLAVGLSDFTSSTLIKKNVQRLRPCNDPEIRELVVQRAPCGSGYSFTSSHAANHFAAAVYLSLILGALSSRIKPVLLCWAGGIAYAQVYVGVHYPGDVLAGGLLGALIGWWTATTFRRWAWVPGPVK